MVKTIDGHVIKVGDSLFLYAHKNVSYDNQVHWDDHFDYAPVVVEDIENSYVRVRLVNPRSDRVLRQNMEVFERTGKVEYHYVNEERATVTVGVRDGTASTTQTHDFDGILGACNPRYLIKEPPK